MGEELCCQHSFEAMCMQLATFSSKTKMEQERDHFIRDLTVALGACTGRKNFRDVASTDQARECRLGCVSTFLNLVSLEKTRKHTLLAGCLYDVCEEPPLLDGSRG